MLDIPPEDVVRKGRLEPGKMFLVDLEQGRIVDDEELKHSDRLGASPMASGSRNTWSPYPRSPRRRNVPGPDHVTLLHRQQAFGYTLEDLKYILMPMGNAGEEAIGSMGTDTPRWPSSPTRPSPSSTTSSSSSPRSRTRRSTRSARSW